MDDGRRITMTNDTLSTVIGILRAHEGELRRFGVAHASVFGLSRECLLRTRSSAFAILRTTALFAVRTSFHRLREDCPPTSKRGIPKSATYGKGFGECLRPLLTRGLFKVTRISQRTIWIRSSGWSVRDFPLAQDANSNEVIRPKRGARCEMQSRIPEAPSKPCPRCLKSGTSCFTWSSLCRVTSRARSTFRLSPEQHTSFSQNQFSNRASLSRIFCIFFSPCLTALE